jgi:hypothetical protein
MELVMVAAIFRITAGLLVMALFGFSSPLSAQERIRIGWAGVSPANTPIWVVQEKDYLRTQGLDLRL